MCFHQQLQQMSYLIMRGKRLWVICENKTNTRDLQYILSSNNLYTVIAHQSL